MDKSQHESSCHIFECFKAYQLC